MGWKGLTRDVVMFVVGLSLLLSWLDTVTSALVLIATAAVFTAYAWFRFFKG